MGLLRLFLAISVVVSHTGPLFGLQLLPGPEAVRIFFMISGFYMALVLDQKYGDRPLLFYSNRALRIYPTYWLSIALMAVIGYWPLAKLHGWDLPLASAINLTIFGADLLFLFHHGHWLIVDPVWSLGSELLFYAAIPWLMRLNTQLLVALAVASLALQLGVDHVRPWSSSFLFPANLCFFLYGVLGYRFSTTPLFAWTSERLGGLAAFGALVLLMGREFIPLFRNYSWMHYIVAGCSIPFTFRQFKTVQWDRWIGELSYPVYMLHAVAIMAADRYLGRASVLWVLALTLPASIATVIWLEGPIERWRERRTQKVRQSGVSASAPSVRPVR